MASKFAEAESPWCKDHLEETPCVYCEVSKLKQQLAERDAEIERFKKLTAHYCNQYGAAELEWFEKRDQLRTRLEDAERIIQQGVELMPLHHLGKWEGVRGWLEAEHSPDSAGKDGG
jgi:DNA-directed RNA polymerase subunit F